MLLDENFWNSRYQNQNTGWDLGIISTPLKEYFDQLNNKELTVLIPGGGNSYEAEYLHINGFSNVYVVDLSETALDNLQKRIPSFPKEHLLHSNFFDLEDSFDLIIEQTFFCALNPNLRPQYAIKMNELLNPKGKLVGVLFNVPLYNDHPPFGGNKEEYIPYFQPYFELKTIAPCYNSVSERAQQELFITFIKK